MLYAPMKGRSSEPASPTAQNSSHVVPVLVRGGYYGNGRIGDGNRLRLREAAMYALDKAACKMVPVFAHPALNERCYGDLQVRPNLSFPDYAVPGLVSDRKDVVVVSG